MEGNSKFVDPSDTVNPLLSLASFQGTKANKPPFGVDVAPLDFLAA